MAKAKSLEHIREQLNIDLNSSKADKEQIQHFYDHLVMVFGNDMDSASNWLRVSNAEFKQSTASELLLSEQGVATVTKVLRKILEQDSRIG